VAREIRIGIVASRFNDFITDPLLKNAVTALRQKGVKQSHIEVVRVPGAFEIPIVAKKLALSNRFDSILCLGAIIRGETPHFDFLSAEVSRGIGQVSLEVGIPVIHGVLTTNTVEQAIERSDSKRKNRGEETALCALEMATLIKVFK
jgi:6,7-dimethyl-8-ribityllumazine synthase